MTETYGAKCMRCAHIEHRGRERAPIPWLTMQGLECVECDFCQMAALHRALASVGMGGFDPETRQAIHAFERGDDHPLIDKLRESIQALEQTVEFMGKRWKVVDAQHDEADDMDDTHHWHLTLVEVADAV